MSGRVEAAIKGRDVKGKLHQIKANASMFRKLRRHDKGNGLKFNVERYDDVVLEQILEPFFDVAEKILPRNRKVSRNTIFVTIPERRAEIAGRIKSHLKHGQRVEFSTNIAQFIVMYVQNLLKIESNDDYLLLLRKLKTTEIKTTMDFINVLKEYLGEINED